MVAGQRWWDDNGSRHDAFSGPDLTRGAGADHPVTPDGRYFVVRGRLWRRADPGLDPAVRTALVADLMAARRAVRSAAGDEVLVAEARAGVDRAKVALGERGAPWWTDGSPDLNRRMARLTPYADWYAGLTSDVGGKPS